MPVGNTGHIVLLCLSQMVAMLGFGMAIPLLPFVIEGLGGHGSELGWLIAAYSILQFFAAPVWGGLSDLVGRKPVLIIGTFGNAMMLLFFGLATEMWMLFAARIVSGLMASALFPTTMAYIGDSTSESDRSDGIGKVTAAASVGLLAWAGDWGPAGWRIAGHPVLRRSAAIPCANAGHRGVLARVTAPGRTRT